MSLILEGFLVVVFFRDSFKQFFNFSYVVNVHVSLIAVFLFPQIFTAISIICFWQLSSTENKRKPSVGKQTTQDKAPPLKDNYEEVEMDLDSDTETTSLYYSCTLVYSVH